MEITLLIEEVSNGNDIGPIIGDFYSGKIRADVTRFGAEFHLLL